MSIVHSCEITGVDVHALGHEVAGEIETYAEKKRKLLERIQAHKLLTKKVKRKKVKKARKPLTVRNGQEPISGQTVAALDAPTIFLQPHRDDDEIFEALFHQYMIPKILPSIRCDTMEHFPTALTNCLNSGNIDGLSDLVRSRLDNQCDIRIMSGAGSLSCKSLLTFFELMNEIHPDRIMCVNTTNIVNHQVTSAMYMKYTDCKALYQAVARTVTDPSLFRIVPATRAQFSARMHLEIRSEDELERLSKLVDSDFDLVVYGCVYVTVSFDEATRKVTLFQMAANLTSAHVAEVM